jgi:hypothetical protein
VLIRRVYAERLVPGRSFSGLVEREGRLHPLNHSPDLVELEDSAPTPHEESVALTERQHEGLTDFAARRGVTFGEALRWHINMGLVFRAMRRGAQVEQASAMWASAAHLYRLLDLAELRGLRLEEFDDLEHIYP